MNSYVMLLPHLCTIQEINYTFVSRCSFIRKITNESTYSTMVIMSVMMVIKMFIPYVLEYVHPTLGFILDQRRGSGRNLISLVCMCLYVCNGNQDPGDHHSPSIFSLHLPSVCACACVYLVIAFPPQRRHTSCNRCLIYMHLLISSWVMGFQTSEVIQITIGFMSTMFDQIPYVLYQV